MHPGPSWSIPFSSSPLLHPALETLRHLSLLYFAFTPTTSLIIILPSSLHCISFFVTTLFYSALPSLLIPREIQIWQQQTDLVLLSTQPYLILCTRLTLLQQSAYPCTSYQGHLHRTTVPTSNTHASLTRVVVSFFTDSYPPGPSAPVTLVFPIL